MAHNHGQCLVCYSQGSATVYCHVTAAFSVNNSYSNTFTVCLAVTVRHNYKPFNQTEIVKVKFKVYHNDGDYHYDLIVITIR